MSGRGEYRGFTTGQTIAAHVLAELAQRRGARLIEIDRGRAHGADCAAGEATRCAERLGYPLARARGAYRPAMRGIERIAWRRSTVITVVDPRLDHDPSPPPAPTPSYYAHYAHYEARLNPEQFGASIAIRDPRHDPHLKRLDVSAREAIARARTEARVLKHDYVGTEHLLLGLLYDATGSAAAGTLRSLGVTAGPVHGQIVQLVGYGDSTTINARPFTPRLKNVLEYALQEALALGHDHVGTEHLLLALMRDGDSIAARLLVEGGIDLLTVRDAMNRMLDALRPTGAKPGFTPIMRLQDRVCDVCDSILGNRNPRIAMSLASRRRRRGLPPYIG